MRQLGLQEFVTLCMKELSALQDPEAEEVSEEKVDSEGIDLVEI